MNKIRIYSDTEIEILLKNPNVVSVNNKMQIEYKNEFKVKAVEEKLKYPEKTSRKIFEENGFDMNIIDDRTPQKRLNSWQKKYKTFGKDYFDNDKYSYKALEKNNNNEESCVIEIKEGRFVIKKIGKLDENFDNKN